MQSINTWETSPERDARRRSIYVFQRRSLSLAMLEVFDAPVLNASCDLRRNTVTALQPLAMYNSEFVNTEARYFAERVSRGAGTETARQIQRAYLIARGREADASELAQAARFLRGIPMPMMH